MSGPLPEAATEPSMLHVALQYYRNEVQEHPQESLPWIPKHILGSAGHPALLVLARRSFEWPSSASSSCQRVVAHPSRISHTSHISRTYQKPYPFLSSKCDTPYLRLRETLEADPRADAVPDLLAAAMSAPTRTLSFMHDSGDLSQLCDAVFEAYVETCDAAELCVRLKQVSGLDDYTQPVDADAVNLVDDGLRHALEDYEMQVTARGASLQTTLVLVAHISQAVSISVPVSNAITDGCASLCSWSNGWHAVSEELLPICAAYMTPALAALVVPVICKAALDGLRSTAPSLQSLVFASDLVRCLGDVKCHLGVVLPEAQYRAEKIHCVHHNATALLSVMRFETRLAVFSKLMDCVNGLEDVVHDFQDVLRSNADFFRVNHVLDAAEVDLIARHLQETEIRLHDAERRSMRLIEAHVEGLASFKRGKYISTFVGGSKAMKSTLVRRGVSRVKALAVHGATANRAGIGLGHPTGAVSGPYIAGWHRCNASHEQRRRRTNPHGRNRHLAALAADLVAFHRNEATEAAAAVLLRDLEEENSRVAAAIDRACAAALDTSVSDALLKDQFHAISDVWMSRKDTSLHWVLTRHKRLRACASIVGTHLPAVLAELPAAAAGFQTELSAVSAVSARSTIGSACVDEFLDKYSEIAGRIECLSEALARNLQRVDEFCSETTRQVEAFSVYGVSSQFDHLSDWSASEVSNALLRHVQDVIDRFVPNRNALVNECGQELVDVGFDDYRDRIQTRTCETMAAAVINVVARFAKDVFEPSLVDDDDRNVRDPLGRRVVLSVPTFADFGPAAREILSTIAGKAIDLVSGIYIASTGDTGAGVLEDLNAIIAYGDAIAALERGDLVPTSNVGAEECASPSRSCFRVSSMLVVEFDDADAEEALRCSNVSDRNWNADAMTLRIDGILAESAHLRDTIMRHLSSSKDELALHITTIVSEMRGRAWLLDAAADQIRYDVMVMTAAAGRSDTAHHNMEDQIRSLSTCVLPQKGSHDELIRSLAAKVLDTEQALLEDVRDKETRAIALHSELEWVRDAQSYSSIDLEVKLNEVGMTLDHCVDEARRGASLVDDLSRISAAFDGIGSLNALSPMHSIATAFTTLLELKERIKSFSGLVDRFLGMSWDGCRRDIAAVMCMVSEHQRHVQTLGKSAGLWAMFHEYSDAVSTSTEALELMNAVCAAPLQDRHWTKLGSLCDITSPSKSSLLSAPSPSKLWSLIVETVDGSAISEVEDLLALATREGKLRNTFDSIKDQWMCAIIQLGAYKSKGDIFLESSTAAETMDGLEDAIMTLGSMASNRASNHFREEIKDFIKLLSNIEESMRLWLSTQSVWSYMEAVFDGGDIALQLPEEAARFADIDSRYLDIVRETVDVPRFAEFFCSDDKREAFVVLLGELEMCQKSLSAYLESKRKIFPRFYFVSDSTLLEILSNGSNPRAVQRHFQAGLFDGIDHLTFESDSSVLVTHLVSKEGESVELRTPITANGPAEVWLTDLVDSMRETMQYEARRAAKEVHRTPLEEFLFGRPAQMALLGLQLKWTADVQSALYQSSLGKKGILRKVLVEYEATLSKLVELTLSNDLSPVQRTSLETCITIFIHQKDVIGELIDKRLADPKSFDWLKHCRFRWREDKGSLFVSICDNEFEYGYEYLGVKERLVMTPLTDVCYVALTQAVGMNCGGAPAGPAGTGKTETTKDLGNTLGRYVVVFNCSDQMDHHMMGRIFKGLAQAGFWGCFDEFNRINLDVLSVCAQQLNCVFTALKERKQTVVFTDGDSIPLNPEVGYFITMNPGYAGRQELPENLKALFRGVTMMAPDRRIIMKVKLAAAGFQDSEVISRKFDRLYSLCEQQLSKQPHYDFGLRNILSVLRTAGAAKRANPTITEMVLIMKTLYDMNVSKFVSEDARTFSALMHDVFPRADSAPPSASDFCEALRETCDEVGWCYHEDWADKCMQLYQSSIVRHGIMVVGPSRSGKSTAIDAVARTLTRLGTKTSVWKMNPKSITAPQMFGKLDASTGDWTDGVFSQLWKRAARTSHNVWIVVDGPVDAVWIENLNTVLDDNKVLTLANGDRVRMMPTMRLVFEAENLNNASPATVSRAGVVFISSSVLGWRPILLSYLNGNGFIAAGGWISELVEACLGALEAIAAGSTKLVGPAGTWTSSTESMPFIICEASMMESFIAYIDGLLARHATLADALRQVGQTEQVSLGGHVGDPGHKIVEPEDVSIEVKYALIFCAAWGFGGALPRAARTLFSTRLRERFGDLLSFVTPKGSIYDFLYDVETQTWKLWADLAQGDGKHATILSSSAAAATSFQSVADFSSITVTTPEDIRCRYLIDLVLGAGKIPHLVGPLGTGKTTIVSHYCDQRRQTDGVQSRSFAFSALTSPEMLYNSLDSCLEKRQGCNYGPAGGGSMIFVMDDLSMPQQNEWGDQVTNELLRQLFQLDGFYRLTKPIGEFRTVSDVSYVATSKFEDRLCVPNRLLGIMRTIYVDYPTDADILQIVNRIIDTFLGTTGRHLASGVVAQLRRLGRVVVKICATVARNLGKSTASPDRFHYMFGMRQPCSIVRFVLSKLDAVGGLANIGGGTTDTIGGADSVHSTAERASNDFIVKLFAHECRRELLDMIVSDAEIRTVSTTIDECIQEAFGAAPKPGFFSSFISGDEFEGEDTDGRSTATVCLATGRSGYRDIVGSGPNLATQVEKAMTKARQKTGTLVLFDDALHHVLKVSRVLESDRRSVMLVGVGGSGKKSVAKVAAAVAGARFVHPTKSTTYSVHNFLGDLGNSFKRSGIKGESTCFLMSDADVCDPVFLDYVNQQLSTGRIAGIFEKEDVDLIVVELRPAFKESNPGEVDNEDTIMDFFWDRVSRHFHFCFSFSPTGDVLAQWVRQFPSLLASCTVDWFHPWPQDALRSLANRFLPKFGDSVPDAISQIHSMMMRLSDAYFEETGRQVHITPKSFLSFVGSIGALYTTKLDELRDTRDSLSLGLEKMVAAKDQVDKMKVELEEKQIVLAQSKQEIAALIEKIDQSTQEATVERHKVQKIVKRVTKKAKEIFQTKLEAERDLEAAKPALDAALEALNSITPKDINSLKALRNPPDVIKRIMDCVLILRHMRVARASWHEVKGLMVLEASYPEALKMMSDMGFLQKLLNFPKEEMNDETVELLQPYFRSGDFNYDSAKKASGNVAGLCNWAEAMCKYHMVARDVEPKILRLKESKKELNAAKKEQEGAEHEKEKVEAALRGLEEKLESANGDMRRVQRDADTTELKLNNAVTLIESLGGEGTRWLELKNDIDREERNLLGNCLLACTFTSYLGPIGATHRGNYLQAAKDLCSQLCIESSEAFDPVGFLTKPADVLLWLEASLPADVVSMQNGALFASSFRTTRIPFVIDPQGQCILWIQRMFPEAVCAPISSAAFMETLQSAVVRGVPFIVQNVDSNFGPVLDGVLDRESQSGSSPSCIKIGDKEVEVAEGFQVVLTTRLANPSISPENFAKCTVIDFTVTGDGLEEQFLGFLISRDEAELNLKRQSLDDDVRRCEAKMKQLEKDLLDRLSSHQGDILEDTHLIGVLADTKKTTKLVADQLKEASVTKLTISDTCEKYRPCAKIASLLYFALCDFARLNYMYETSLEQFLVWFDESIRAAAPADTTARRVANLLAELKLTVYFRAQCGMFECDKDAWRLLMAVVVVGTTMASSSTSSGSRRTDQAGTAKDNRRILYDILAMGKMPVKERRKKVEWLSDEQWRNALHLQQVGLFDNLVGGSQGLSGLLESKWKTWVNLEEPEAVVPPIQAGVAGANVNATLHQLALIRALRPDRSKAATRLFVEGVLGPNFFASKAADLAQVVEASGPDRPIICVISPGADPTSRIHDLARKFKTKCLDVSMGQGQEVIARRYLEIARQRGDWVCIQNAHLACGFLKELADASPFVGLTASSVDKVDEALSDADALSATKAAHTNAGFRLWITTEPTVEFPLGLLHRGMRITCEPPSGFHDALLAIMAGLGDETLEEVKTPFWKPMLVSLVCMHVLSQERKRFGPIGWVVGYEFSGMDLLSSLAIVSNHLFKCQRKAKAAAMNGVGATVTTAATGSFDATEIDWEALRYLVSVIQYGGRIVDDRDQRLMDVLVKRFISSKHCDGGIIHLIDPKRHPKIHHMYRLRVDEHSTRENLVAEVDSLPATDIPELFGLDGATERIALELTGRAMFASLEKIIVHGGVSMGEGQVASPGRDNREDRSNDFSIGKNHHEDADGDIPIGSMDLHSIASEPLRAVFRMELAQLGTSSPRDLSGHRRSLLQAAVQCKGQCLHLGAISNPKALLNAVLQDLARKRGSITVDELAIGWTVTKLTPASVRDPPKEGLYFWGLVLEGGVIWDDQRDALRLGCTNGTSPGVRNALPVMHVTAVEKGKQKWPPAKRTYQCPLYMDKSRKAAAFVDFVELAIDGAVTSDELVEQGVALMVE